MKETRVGKPVAVGDITIVPLERVSVHHAGGKGRVSVFVSREPIGVVVTSPRGQQAISVSGEEVPLATYIQDIEGLQEVLDGL